MNKKILTCCLKMNNIKNNYDYFYIGHITENKRIELKKKFKNLFFDDQVIDFSSTAKIYKHYNFCELIFEQVFETLYINLNKLHNCQLPKEQWQVILGEWLRQFIYIVYNNYSKLKKHIYSKKFTEIFYLHDKNKYFPSDLANLNKLYNNTLWNEKINGQIIEFLDLKKKKIRWKNNKKIEIIYKKPKVENFILKPFKLLDYFQNINEPFIQKTCLTFLEEKKLELKLGLLPKRRYFPDENYFPKINLKLRNKLKLDKLKKKNIFEDLILYLVPLYLPAMAIENFSFILKHTENLSLQSKPRFILTSFNSFDNFLNFYISKKFSEKVPIIFLQHGNISSLDIKYKFTTENKIAKFLLTWGHKNYKKDVKLFNVNIMKYKIKKIKKDQIGVFCHPLRQHACFSDISQSLINEKKLNYTIQKLKKFDEKIKNKIHFNLFPGDEAVERNYFTKKIKKNGFKTFKSKNFYKIIDNTKINLFLYDSTGIYESLALNIPTFAYFEDPLKTIIPKYKKTFKYLINSKILFTDLDKLIYHLEKIWPNINEWWKSSTVQKNIKCFNNEVNINSDNNVDKIATKLRSLTS